MINYPSFRQITVRDGQMLSIVCFLIHCNVKRILAKGVDFILKIRISVGRLNFYEIINRQLMLPSAMNYIWKTLTI